MNNARYRMMINATNAVIIKDMGPHSLHKTVTNDASWVVQDLQHRYIFPVLTPEKQLFYIDSLGLLSQIMLTWKDGHASFNGFCSIEGSFGLPADFAGR